MDLGGVTQSVLGMQVPCDEPNPVDLRGPGAVLALECRWLPQLSLPGIQDPSVHANVGLSHLKESVIHSIHPLGSKAVKLSQILISILFQTVRIPLELRPIFLFAQLFSCRFLLSSLSRAARGVLLLIPRALLNKP